MISIQQPLVAGLAYVNLEKVPVDGICRLDLVCASNGQKPVQPVALMHQRALELVLGLAVPVVGEREQDELLVGPSARTAGARCTKGRPLIPLCSSAYSTVLQTHRLARAFDEGVHDVLISWSSRFYQDPGFLLSASRHRTKRSCRRHKAPLRPGDGFCRVRNSPASLHLFEDHPQALHVLAFVNRAITPHFPGLAQILEDMSCDQTLFGFSFHELKLVGGLRTGTLLASQPGLIEDCGRSVHENAWLIVQQGVVCRRVERVPTEVPRQVFRGPGTMMIHSFIVMKKVEHLENRRIFFT